MVHIKLNWRPWEMKNDLVRVFAHGHFHTFAIEGFNEEGDLIARKTITDPRDSGSVNLEND